MLVGDIMSPDVYTVAPSDTVLRAEETMKREHIRHLPVVDGDVLVGLVTQRDIMAVAPSPLSTSSEEDDIEAKARMRVERIMRGFVESVRPDTDAVEAADRMLDLKIGCLPVLDERKRVVGIVTEADYVRLARDMLRQ
jgi:CBS domain-containing protein